MVWITFVLLSILSLAQQPVPPGEMDTSPSGQEAQLLRIFFEPPSGPEDPLSMTNRADEIGTEGLLRALGNKDTNIRLAALEATGHLSCTGQALDVASPMLLSWNPRIVRKALDALARQSYHCDPNDLYSPQSESHNRAQIRLLAAIAHPGLPADIRAQAIQVLSALHLCDGREHDWHTTWFLSRLGDNTHSQEVKITATHAIQVCCLHGD